MKTRKDILSQPFVNRSDIQRLLWIPREKASEIFRICDEEEQKKEYRAHTSKVPLENVLKVAGVRYAFLEKQVNELTERRKSI